MGSIPVLYVREVQTVEELEKLIHEEPNVRILILGAETGQKGLEPLMTFLAGRFSGRFPMPITVVPGNLTMGQVDVLTQNRIHDFNHKCPDMDFFLGFFLS